MREPLVSIIIRSFNEAWALRETLPALRAQDYKNWELIVIDSGSTDGSVELIRAAQPQHFIQIEPHEYHPARVMNSGMELARSNFCIFLNADATPQGNNWLRPLVRPLFVPHCAAVFGKQIPRPNCKAVFAHDYERCFGRWGECPHEPKIKNADAQATAREDARPITKTFSDKRDSKHWEHFFSMASSGIRKDIWAQRKFDEHMRYSEDDEYTRWCRAQGYQIVYVPESVAMHSHNYTPQEAWKRSFGEAKALAAVWNGKAGDFNFPKTVLLGWLNDARRDLFFCARKNRLSELPHAMQIRWQQRKAKLVGFREGWKTYREKNASEIISTPLPVWAKPVISLEQKESL
jgi:rhamnosyltransferase